jgi:hypothetical protein
VGSDARALLEQMKQRLERGPHAALGIAEGANAQAARTAFLQLTKTYHPAKFARETPEVVRLANEVFLALRAAHDHIQTSARRASQNLPPVAAGRGSPTPALGVPIIPGRGPQPRADGTLPRVGPPTPGGRGAPAAAPATAAPTPTPTSSPIVTIKPAPATAPATAKPAAPSTAPSTAAVRAPELNRTQPLPRNQPLPAAGSQPLPSATGPITTPLPSAATTAAPAPGAPPGGPGAGGPSGAPKPAHRMTTGQIPQLPPGVLPGSEEADLEIAMFYLRKKQWAEARKLLHALAARVPADKRYRALLAYARGREAQDEGRHDEARAEFNRALQLDPDLGPAKAALQQVAVKDEPDRPPSGGLLSRLFKK